MDINVELNLWISTCKDCGKSFNIGMLPEFEYGRRIILTEDGLTSGIVNFMEDETCQELSLTINKIFDENGIERIHKSVFFDLMLNLLCDDINGKKIDTAKNHVCEYCHSCNLATYECNPVESKIFTLPVITHKNWDAKSQVERFAIINKKLSEFIAQKNIYVPFKKKLKCCSCNFFFTLTFKRYLWSLKGDYVCPICNKDLRLKLPWIILVFEYFCIILCICISVKFSKMLGSVLGGVGSLIVEINLLCFFVIANIALNMLLDSSWGYTVPRSYNHKILTR